MNTETTRLCIYPKYVQSITGKSGRLSRMLLLKIRETLKKDEHQFVTIEEFCTYTGFKEDQVQGIITD